MRRLRSREALYARPGLQIRRHKGRLYVKASCLFIGSRSMVAAYNTFPGSWPGAPVELFGAKRGAA